MACESLRVEQVDANILDGEYRQLMEQQFERLVAELPVAISQICDRIRPEIQLLIDGLIWTNRVYRGASAGQIEVDIAYKEYPPMKISLHFLLSMVLPYIATRASSLLEHSAANMFVSKTTAMIEAIRVLHYLNFLRVGGYSTLVESFLNLRNWNNNPPTIGS
ncbi:Pex2 / Pex12 amino terminal region [Cooperia oncophora]